MHCLHLAEVGLNALRPQLPPRGGGPLIFFVLRENFPPALKNAEISPPPKKNSRVEVCYALHQRLVVIQSIANSCFYSHGVET